MKVTRQSLITAIVLGSVALAPAQAHSLPLGAGTDSGPRVAASITHERSPIHKTHVDAAFISWDKAEGSLDIRIRHGKKLLDPDDHYLNLQAVDFNGKDVSKFTIPADHEEQLSFLGKAGDTVWNAPSKFYQGWLPIWAGFGAQVPNTAVKPGSLALRLVKTTGPSWVETYNYNPFDGDVGRTLSSKDTTYQRFNEIKNDSHWHSNWAFGAPGTYTMTLVAEGITPEGKTIKSPERTLVWQVGPGVPPDDHDDERAVVIPSR